MTFKNPPYKLKVLLIGVLSSLSTYSLAATTCSNPQDCSDNVGAALGNEMVIAAGKYQNKVPSIAEFKSKWSDNDEPGIFGYNENVFSLSRSHYQNSSIDLGTQLDVQFTSGTEIKLETSFLKDDKYGPHREDYSLTGVSIGSNEDKTIKVSIPKGVHFILQGAPKEYTDGGITAIDIRGGVVNSQANFTVESPNSTVYDVYSSTLNAQEHEINFSKDSYFSLAATAQDDALVNLDKVHINGLGEWNIGLAARDNGHVNFRNGSITFNHPNSVGFFITTGGNINIEKSVIDVGHGISLFSREDGGQEKPSSFTIKDSSLIAHDALLGVNDHRHYGEDHQDDLDDLAAAVKQPFTFTAENSKLSGRTYVDKSMSGDLPAPKVTFNLSKNSSWTITGDSQLDELSVTDSTLAFSRSTNPRGITTRSGSNFKTLTIHGDLKGNNGLFYMNTSLADKESDKLIIEGQLFGEHKIHVEDSRKRPKTANGQVTLVEVQTNGGNGSFEMLQNYVDAGRYRYYFQRNGNQWILNNDKGALSQGNSDWGAQYEISDYANSLISMRQAASQFVYQLQQPLNTRFSSLKNQPRSNNLWLNSNYANNHFDSTNTSYDLTTSGFKQKSYSLQLGYDHILPFGDNNNQVYLGAFVGRGHSSVDFNRDYKDGNIKAWTTGIYAGWQNASGWFADGSYRYSHFKTTANKIDDTNWHANSIDALLGRDISLADKWVVIPKLGLTVGRLSGDKYTNSTTFYRTQLGAEIKTSVALKQVNFKPYMGAYWLHDKNSLGHVIVDDENLTIKGAGSSGLFEAGVGVDFDRNNHADFMLNYANGQKTEQKFGASLNYRYSW